MIQISRAFGEGTGKEYYREKFVMEEYYTQGNALRGHWFGREAEALGLIGEIKDRDFDRLMEGRRPDARFDVGDLKTWERDGERQMIRDKATNEVQAVVGRTRTGWSHSLHPEKRFRSMESARTHAYRELVGIEIASGKKQQARRAWDIVSRPGKTVSVAAVVGGDQRIIEAHRRANAAMLRAIEQLIEAHGGGSNPNIPTGQFVVARFEHLTARPEEMKTHTGEMVLYPAALLHTHNVMMNWTRTPDGKVRAIDPHELFKFQAIGKAVYQAHMARELRAMGYETEIGKNGATEIKGYTPEYIQSESLRSAKIQEHLQAAGLDGARAADLVAKAGRNEKLDLSDVEVSALHKANDAAHGHQNERIIAASIERAKTLEIKPEISAEQAVTKAKNSLAERYSVFEHWDLVVKALEYGQGHVMEDAIAKEIGRRTQTIEQREMGIQNEFILVDHVREGKPGLRYTTDVQYNIEADLCEVMAQGRNQVQPLVQDITPEQISEQLKDWSIVPDTPHMLREARRVTEENIADLRERLTPAVDSESDPYWLRWQDSREEWRASVTNWYQDIDAERAQFEQWREPEITKDLNKLARMERRLGQLDSVDDKILRNRLELKIDASQRFEMLTGGHKPNADQIAAAHAILTSPDRLTGIVGSAGAGKTTVLQTIQSIAQEQGYRVVGLGPTSKAVEKLQASGIQSTTLQGFLIANTPEAVQRTREKISTGESRIETLKDKLEQTKVSRATTEKSLEKARMVLVAAQARYKQSELKAHTRTPASSLRAAMQRERRREYYAARLAVIAEQIAKAENWVQSASDRLKVYTERIPQIEQKIADTSERVDRTKRVAYERGVSLEGTPRLIFADESSLAGNRQFAELFKVTSGQDRVVLVGDPGQHESIEAARAFDLMLQAGMRRGELYQIVRQENPALRAAVEKCTWGKHHRALDILDKSGHVIVMRKRADRLEKLTELFMRAPELSSVIVPDNKTRLELNEMIRVQWKETGRITGEGLQAVILVPEQDMTRVDRETAAQYETGQVIRFREASDQHGIERGSYWHVASIDADANQITVHQGDKKLTIDPEQFGGSIEAYKQESREFAVGDRVLFKKKDNELGIVNGSAGTITAIDQESRQMTVSLTKNGREIKLNAPQNELASLPHLEHGYATTSYSIQGDTSEYTYGHFDTADKSAKRLISRAMFYVGISRPKQELQVVTNDKEKLRNILQVSGDKAMALSPDERYQFLPEQYEQKHRNSHGMKIGA